MNDSNPLPAPNAIAQALEHHRAGRLAEAAAIYGQILEHNPSNAEANHLLGTLKATTGDLQEAEQLLATATRLKPEVAPIWASHGDVLAALGRRQEALASLERAIALDGSAAHLVYLKFGLMIELGDAARVAAEAAVGLERDPGNHFLLTARGNALFALGEHAAALIAHDAAVAAFPRNVDALAGRGLCLMELGRAADAVKSFESATALVPGHLVSVLGLAHAQTQVGQPMKALETMDRVIAAVPGNATAHYVRGHALSKLQRPADAAASFEKAATLAPEMTDAAYWHADASNSTGRHEAAMASFERVLSRRPDHAPAMSGLAMCATYCADWETLARVAPQIETHVSRGSRGIIPFSFLSLSASKELQLRCAQTFSRFTCPAPESPLPRVRRRSAGRIRIGYLSSDFRRHAMAYQMAELFEVHDRERFEILGYSGGPDDGSPVRRRIAKAFDAFHDVAAESNESIARRMHADGIDVAVDLNGHTIHTRIGALAWRPAAAQATYLGYPGTSGADFIDYVIADDTVAPMSDQPFFTEKIVHLPGCYQVSDRLRKPAARIPSRFECGLPNNAFVFACFNSSYKIAPGIFDVWMRILDAVPGSVLWLVRSSTTFQSNLRRRAASRGIDPSRLVFCGMVEPGEHLARHALADLYLDTLPYNSHGTASFALWGGLPMLTCMGPTFAGRVAASLLRAIDMPELVTFSLDEYRQRAIALANDRPALAALRAKLSASRETAALFDTDRFARNIEAAYMTMLEIAQRGEPPRSFVVSPAA